MHNRTLLRCSLLRCGIALLACTACGVGSADESRSISEVEANRIGLSVQWSTQVAAVNSDYVSSMALVVDDSDATTFFEITGGRVREVVSQRDILPNGKSFGSGAEGLAKAREYAEIRREMLEIELAARGITDPVTIQEITLPRTTIYVAAGRGMVQAIDAETGKMLWHAQVGDPRTATVGIGASAKHVAVVVGARVYCLESKTGKTLWDLPCSHAVTNSPVVNDRFVFIPLWDGHVQVFPLENYGRGFRYLTARGAPSDSPTLAGNFLGWATDAATFDVAEIGDDLRLMYRMRTDSPVMSSATTSKGHFFLASLNGHVYTIDQRRQRLVWASAVGEQVTKSPIPVGDHLFVFASSGNLFKMDMATGLPSAGWEEPIQGVFNFVGFSEKHLFVQDQIGDLVMLDQTTGSRLGAIGYRGLLKVLPNQSTDRLYVCHSSGMVQCLREIANVNPIFHVDEAMTFDPTTPESTPAGTETTPPPPEMGEDPFKNFPGRDQKSNETPPPDSNDPFRRGGGG